MPYAYKIILILKSFFKKKISQIITIYLISPNREYERKKN